MPTHYPILIDLSTVPPNKVLNFLDAYSGYNQIPMAASDMNKTTFITDDANYFYKVMPLVLKTQEQPTYD